MGVRDYAGEERGGDEVVDGGEVEEAGVEEGVSEGG